MPDLGGYLLMLNLTVAQSIPRGCPDSHDPCAHPELFRSLGAQGDMLLGLVVVAVIALSVWAARRVWQWRQLRRAADETRRSREARKRIV